MEAEKTKEPQYQVQVEFKKKRGLTKLGVKTNADWHDDPRRLLFVMSRYKFVSKMLSGKDKVLEVGCGDAFSTRIVLQEVGSITAIDFDPLFVKEVNNLMDQDWKVQCFEHDILEAPVRGAPFSAAYSLDVIEHIAKEEEETYLTNIAKSLSSDGVLIVGSPSLESQPHASQQSRIGHINCKSAKDLKTLMEKYFQNVFIFSMNDELVHTGYYPMAHYLFGVGVGVKSV